MSPKMTKWKQEMKPQLSRSTPTKPSSLVVLMKIRRAWRPLSWSALVDLKKGKISLCQLFAIAPSLSIQPMLWWQLEFKMGLFLPTPGVWLDDNNLRTRTNHENRKRMAWLFHFPTRNQILRIVAGGMDRNNSRLDSTEMIDLDQESPKWTKGMLDKSKIVYR